MTFDYRVCFRSLQRWTGFNVHEIHYDETGKIVLYSKRPVSPFGETPEELYYDMKQYMDAFDKDTLDLDEIDWSLPNPTRVNPNNY